MIDLSIENKIATVSLNNAPVNALNSDWIKNMHRVLDEVETNDEVSVLRIRSGLKVFSAGGDLKIIRDLIAEPAGRDEMVDMVSELQNIFFRIEKLGLVTIAEIGGAALGGGMELALACDLRVASSRAKLGLPEINLGLLPGAGGTQRMTRICGESIARRLIFGAEIISGNEALKLGLVQWCIPLEELSEWTDSLVLRLSQLPRHAIAASKKCIEASYDDSIDGYQLELTETRKLHDYDETQQRVNDFINNSR